MPVERRGFCYGLLMAHQSFSEWWDEIPVLGDGLDGEDIDQDDFADLEELDMDDLDMEWMDND